MRTSSMLARQISRGARRLWRAQTNPYAAQNLARARTTDPHLRTPINDQPNCRFCSSGGRRPRQRGRARADSCALHPHVNPDGIGTRLAPKTLSICVYLWRLSSARTSAANRSLVCTPIARRSCATREDCLDPRRVATARSVAGPSGVDDRRGPTSPCR